MIKFRQKYFNAIDYIKKHPTLPISTGTLIFSGSNYFTNSNRYKKDRKYQKEQLKAMENLTNSLTDTVNSMKDMNNSFREANEDFKIYNKKLIDDNSNRLGKENKKKSDNKKSLFNIFRRKNYSTQDGSYTGNKTISKNSYKTGALVETGMGLTKGASTKLNNNTSSISNGLKTTTIDIETILSAGIGALTEYLNNILDKSSFNKGLSKINSYDIVDYIDSKYYTEDIERKTISKSIPTNRNLNYLMEEQEEIISEGLRSSVNPRGIIYDIDGDPKKYTLNLMCRGDVMIILFNDPSKYDLKNLNNILDNYCKNYKNADYVSNKVSKNSYIIEINIVEDTYRFLINALINSGFKLNIITGNKI